MDTKAENTIRRIRRALKREGQTLHISRSPNPPTDTGAICITDDQTNSLVAGNCDLNSLAQELLPHWPAKTGA